MNYLLSAPTTQRTVSLAAVLATLFGCGSELFPIVPPSIETGFAAKCDVVADDPPVPSWPFAVGTFDCSFHILRHETSPTSNQEILENWFSAIYAGTIGRADFVDGAGEHELLAGEYTTCLVSGHFGQNCATFTLSDEKPVAFAQVITGGFPPIARYRFLSDSSEIESLDGYVSDDDVLVCMANDDRVSSCESSTFDPVASAQTCLSFIEPECPGRFNAQQRFWSCAEQGYCVDEVWTYGSDCGSLPRCPDIPFDEEPLSGP